MSATPALQPLLSYLSGLESRIASLEGGSPAPVAALSSPASAASAAAEDSRAVQEFDALLGGAPATLSAVAAKIGGDCVTLVREGRRAGCAWRLAPARRRTVAPRGEPA